MSREIIRENSELTKQETLQLAQDVDYTVLGTISEDGWPYTVNVSTILVNNTFYFHCAKRGHKIDNLKFNDKCCLTGTMLINNAEIYSYKSFVAFGKARLVEDIDEKKEAFMGLLKKWDPKYFDQGITDQELNSPDWWAIDIEKITGKAHTHKKK